MPEGYSLASLNTTRDLLSSLMNSSQVVISSTSPANCLYIRFIKTMTPLFGENTSTWFILTGKTRELYFRLTGSSVQLDKKYKPLKIFIHASNLLLEHA